MVKSPDEKRDRHDTGAQAASNFSLLYVRWPVELTAESELFPS
jgi:hypothetical protein